VQRITTENVLVALGQRVRQLRKRHGYSQEAFADATGLHRTWMGAVERGERNLSFNNLVLISQALGITLSSLLSGVEKNASKPGHPRS
jgi:transcriptional regulator with XRE-family HTH domain